MEKKMKQKIIEHIRKMKHTPILLDLRSGLHRLNSCEELKIPLKAIIIVVGKDKFEVDITNIRKIK